MKTKSPAIALMLLSLSGCAVKPQLEAQTKHDEFLRPDMIIEFEPGESDVNNIAPISEAVFSLLETGNTEILLSTSTSDQPGANSAIASRRIQYLSRALKQSGIPDFKIKKVTRWNGHSDIVEIYALREGWKGLPFDMLHYGFAPKINLPPVIIQTVSTNYKEPEEPQQIDSFLVKKGPLERVITEFSEQIGWDIPAIHSHETINIPDSYTMELNPLTLPVEQKHVETLINYLLQREGLNNLAVALHLSENERKIVLTEKEQ